MFVGEIFGKKLFGKQIMHLHLLNSCFLSFPYSLDIYTKKHKALWYINDINYIGIPFMVLSQKSLDSANEIDRKAVLKKKGTRKDTENVRCLILWDSLWIYIRSKIPRARSENFLHTICFTVCRLEMIITTAETTFKTQRSLIVLQKLSWKKLFTLKIIRLVLYTINFEGQNQNPFNYRLMLEVR